MLGGEVAGVLLKNICRQQARGPRRFCLGGCLPPLLRQVWGLYILSCVVFGSNDQRSLSSHSGLVLITRG